MSKRNAQRPGYKHTKVGWIPEEWECVRLKSLDPFLTSGSRGWAKYYSQSGSLFLRIANLVRGNVCLDLSDTRFVQVPEDCAEAIRTLVRSGDILISITADLGIIGFISDDIAERTAYINQHICLLRVRSESCSRKFVAYSLAGPVSQKRFSRIVDQGAKAGLNLEAIRSFPVPFPPLVEQERIAEVLLAWDRAIALTDRLIAAKQRLKKGLMQQLLTGRLRFPEFGKPARRRDELPIGWKRVRLQEVAQVNPSQAKPGHNDCCVTFLAMADISEQGRMASKQERPYLSVSNGFTSFLDGDILVAKITPCFENGKGAHLEGLTNGIGFGSTEFHVIRAHNADARFLFLHTQSRPFRGRGEANMTGSAGQKRVPAEFVRDYPIPLPEREEQRRIAATMSACDREIHLLAQKRARLQKQKKGLMQKLLTGEVRVKVRSGQRRRQP